MYKVFLASFFVAVSFFAFAAPVACAETHITDDTSFESDAAWTKEGSPYVIDNDAYIPSGTVLSIGPGVTVTTSSSSPGSLFIRGTLIVAGTADEHVSIGNLTGFWIAYSTSTISYADIDVPTGLNVSKSSLVISSSTISDSDNAIDTEGSNVSITGSILSGNNYGVYSRPMPPPIFQAFNFFHPALAYAQTAVDNPTENHIIISNSSLINNREYSIFNSTTNPINAENNWWGNINGPAQMISGDVNYTPWLVQDPTARQKSALCCSNVLFLPGIEASRLYLNQKSFLATSSNELWEPNRNADVEKLFMTPAGQSINSGIYTKDVIDSALGLFPIYKGFIAMMNGVVADKIINSWTAYPYDWRFDVGMAVSQKLIDTVQTLASTSKTGKVTIVAHSNGGLVAKLLAKTLADSGNSNLLDKVIMVAVPQLGTAEAIAGLLHGDDEKIADGLVLDQSVARELAENMPGGYGLLPSRAYFSNPGGFSTPLVSFASSSFTSFNFSADGGTVENYNSLRSFLTGSNDHRPEPSDADINSPSLLHSAMIDNSQKIHTSIDGFSFSSTTKAVILAGWGKTTLAGITYYEKISCSTSALMEPFGKAPVCSSSLEHSASTTLLGDGTVVMQSAAAPISGSSNYYFDLGSESKGKLIGDDHSDILSTNSAVAFVRDEVIGSTSIPLPPYISDKQPTMADVHQNDLVVSVHSPVDLNIYDSQGRHTGPIANTIPGSDLGMFETGIPGSEYVPNEEDKSIRVPYGTDYKITFSGTGIGSFEVDTEHDVNGVDVADTVFADMPVTPLLKAELVLATTTFFSGNSIATSTATTTQMILFDFNGDGAVDATSTPHQQYDPILDMESYQVIISSLGLSPSKEKIMLDKLGVIIDCLRKKKPLKEVGKPNTQAINAAKQGIADIQNQHWIFKNLDPVRKQKLEDIFEAFLDDIDTQS